MLLLNCYRNNNIMSSCSFYYLLMSTMIVFDNRIFADNVNLRPRQQINAETNGRRFQGQRQSSSGVDESDYFKLLERDGDSLMVGARNAVYNLSLSTLEIQQQLTWSPPAKTVEDCLMKGKSKLDCHNYIRVLARTVDGRSLICGTNAFAPKCREYRYSADDRSFRDRREFDGQAIAPYDPRHNSTALYLHETGEIYAGTVSDFAGNDPLIYRKSLADHRGVDLRTQRDDVKVLDSPNFVSSFVDGEHVYFWYRETAAESVDNDGDQQVYARVARVCKNDRGGPRPMLDRWTSFVKARLNCSLPGTSPFYFNELQSTSNPITASDGITRLVYAVFSTPISAVRMSAICVFRMEEIRRIFDTGDFKVQDKPQSLWTSMRAYNLPKPRPGACVPESTRLQEPTLAFITRHPLLYDAIPNALAHGPLLVEGLSLGDRSDLTQIAVAGQIRAVSGLHYDVLFVGTADGKVLKVVEIVAGHATLVESIRVFNRSSPIVNLLTSDNQLIIVSQDQVVALPLFHCMQRKTCSACVHLQDPFCAWDLYGGRCIGRNNGDWKDGDYVQNIPFGRSEQCPEGAVDLEYFDVNAQYSHHSNSDAKLATGQYTTQSLTVAIILTLAIASAIGFFVGFRVSRLKLANEHHASSSSSSGSASEYDTFGRARLTRHDSLNVNAGGIIGGGNGGTSTKIDHVYGVSPKMDAVSLVLTLPHGGGGSGLTTPKTEKNLLATLNNGTLPKDYKVKKVYL